MDIPLLIIGIVSIITIKIVSKILDWYLLINEYTDRKNEENKKEYADLIAEFVEKEMEALSAGRIRRGVSSNQKIQAFKEESSYHDYFSDYKKISLQNRKKMIEIITAGFAIGGQILNYQANVS